MSYKYIYPISIQTVLPENYYENENFKDNLKLLQSYDFEGVELNIAYPERADFKDITAFLSEYDLKLTKFASGLTAKTFGLSLSSEDISIRKKSIEKIIEATSLLNGICDGIILGFFKGVPAIDKMKARNLFKDSLKEIAPHAAKNNVQIIVEATNRYESSVANTLDDTFELFEDIKDNQYVKMLPDTFHMNIEEVNTHKSLQKYSRYYNHIHISDNNRFYPGFGAIDFAEIVDYLNQIDFKGTMAIEGNNFIDFKNDLIKTMEYLIPILC